MRALNVGFIGTKFMSKARSYAWTQAADFLIPRPVGSEGRLRPA